MINGGEQIVCSKGTAENTRINSRFQSIGVNGCAIKTLIKGKEQFVFSERIAKYTTIISEGGVQRLAEDSAETQ
jgi:hypothetical protein